MSERYTVYDGIYGPVLFDNVEQKPLLVTGSTLKGDFREVAKRLNANSRDTDARELSEVLEQALNYIPPNENNAIEISVPTIERIITALQGSTDEKVCKWRAFTYHPSADYMSRVHSETGYSSSCGSTKAYLYSYCPHCGGKVELVKEE